MEEKVNHPKHYNTRVPGIECIDVVEHFDFNVGSCIKYLWRMGLKPGEAEIDDLRKAIWYLERELALILRTNTVSTMEKSDDRSD